MGAALTIVGSICLVLFTARNLLLSGISAIAMLKGVDMLRRADGSPSEVHAENPRDPLRLAPYHWFVGIALTGVVSIALLWIYHDAITGAKQVAPVWVFATSAVVCGGWWAGVVARWFR